MISQSIRKNTNIKIIHKGSVYAAFCVSSNIYLRQRLYGIKRLAYAAANPTQKKPYRGRGIFRGAKQNALYSCLARFISALNQYKIFASIFGQSFSMQPLQFLYIPERYKSIVSIKISKKGICIMLKTKTISFRVDENTYNTYSALAARSRRKLGDYIRLLLEETIQKGGARNGF